MPVTYEAETAWASEALKVAPTLLLIGFWIFMMRGTGMGGVMGGGGGRGGSGIFGVGKAKPTVSAAENRASQPPSHPPV